MGDGLIKGPLIKIRFRKVTTSFGHNMYDNLKFDKYSPAETLDFFMVNISEDTN